MGISLTNTSISLQHITNFAGTLKAAQCVQTVSVLTDTLHGALIDVFKEGKWGKKKSCSKLLLRITCINSECYQSFFIFKCCFNVNIKTRNENNNTQIEPISTNFPLLIVIS